MFRPANGFLWVERESFLVSYHSIKGFNGYRTQRPQRLELISQEAIKKSHLLYFFETNTRPVSNTFPRTAMGRYEYWMTPRRWSSNHSKKNPYTSLCLCQCVRCRRARCHCIMWNLCYCFTTPGIAMLWHIVYLASSTLNHHQRYSVLFL